MSSAARARLMSPIEWAKKLSAPPVLCSRTSGFSGVLIRKWHDIQPESYPALDHHCVTLHLGHPRRIKRRGENQNLVVDVRPGAMSVTPSGAVYQWQTTGPVDYAELYLAPEVIRQVDVEVFDRGGTGFALDDRLGMVDPLAEALFRAVLDEIATTERASGLYLDAMVQALLARLLRLCGHRKAPTAMRLTIAPARLRRVLEHVEAHLSQDLRVADLAAVAGISPFHFSRAFSAATGVAPYAYLMARRLAVAKRLLADPNFVIADVATASGFTTEGQFVRMFKRANGRTPRRFRSEL